MSTELSQYQGEVCGASTSAVLSVVVEPIVGGGKATEEGRDEEGENYPQVNTLLGTPVGFIRTPGTKKFLVQEEAEVCTLSCSLCCDTGPFAAGMFAP